MPLKDESTITNDEQYKAQVREVVKSPVQYSLLWALLQKTQLDQALYQVCHDEPEFFDAWQEIWITLGKDISPHQEPFYRQSKINGFRLVIGAVYYLQSKNPDLAAQAADYIRIARAHQSIHAEQHCIGVLFVQINSMGRRVLDTLFPPTNELKEAEKNLKAAIESVKSYVRLYGSYAWMMLADLYVAYAQLSIDHPTFPMEKSPKLCLAVAQKCYESADQFLAGSKEAIFNASGGKGLETSTRFGISSPSNFEPIILSLKKKLKPIPIKEDGVSARVLS